MQRRQLLRALAGAILASTGMWSRLFGASASPLPRGDDRVLLQSLIDSGRRVPPRGTPYQINAPIHLSAGARVLLDPGARIVYTGDQTGDFGRPVGIFAVEGNGVEITGSDEATSIECVPPSRGVYAVAGRGVQDLKVRNLSVLNCNHVFVTHARGSGDYDGHGVAVTSGSGANVARRVAVIGGGARFDNPPVSSTKDGGGACLMKFVFSWLVEGAVYENTACAVQWWGGNADVKVDGAFSNERKCGDGIIRKVQFRNVHAGCWGSMGRNIKVIDCEGINASDVTFDAEGSSDITFTRCIARDANNGCFATFFLNRNIKFIECQGYQNRRKGPVFRIYNNTQSAINDNIEIIGGIFSSKYWISSMDSRFGPARSITIKNSILKNVVINMEFNNNNLIIIEGNTLDFDILSAEPYNALSAGSTNRFGQADGAVLIRGNKIRSSVRVPDRAAGIVVQQFDYNGAPTSEIIANEIVNFPQDIVCRWRGKNRAYRAKFVMRGNIGSSQVVVEDDYEAASKAVFLTYR